MLDGHWSARKGRSGEPRPLPRDNMKATEASLPRPSTVLTVRTVNLLGEFPLLQLSATCLKMQPPHQEFRIAVRRAGCIAREIVSETRGHFDVEQPDQST